MRLVILDQPRTANAVMLVISWKIPLVLISVQKGSGPILQMLKIRFVTSSVMCPAGNVLGEITQSVHLVLNITSLGIQHACHVQITAQHVLERNMINATHAKRVISFSRELNA